MVSVALVHCTTLMLDRLPEPPASWLLRGERSFAYPHADWRKPRGWCLTFFTNRAVDRNARVIIGVGGAYPGKRSTTYERSLICRDFTLLHRPLPLTDLQQPMSASRRFLNDDGRLSEVAGERLLECVRSLRPELAASLDHLERTVAPVAPEGAIGEQLSQEKDAVGTVLDAAGMGRDVIETWQWPTTATSEASARSVPFLAGMPTLRHIEDQQIAHDYQRFPGMQGDDAYEIGWRVYRRDTASPNPHELFVYNANRTNAETVLGVDMIYVNVTAKSTMLVQYKRMTQESRGWVYRHGPTGERELERMTEVDKNCQRQDDAIDPRLLTTPCMVKLCRATPFLMNSAAHIPGMYLSRAHFGALLRSPDAVGPKQGVRILERDIPRYLNNTTFTTLLKDGWIGTRGTSSDYVIDLIRQSLSNEGPGSVVVGVHRSVTPPGNRRVPL